MNTTRQTRSRRKTGSRIPAGLKYKYQFFISYTSCEAFEVILPITIEFQKYGFTWFLDLEQARWNETIHNAVSNEFIMSKYVLAVITEQSVQQPETVDELQSALRQEIAAGNIKTLPIITGTAAQKKNILEKLPLLSNLRYIEWKNNPHDIVKLLFRRVYDD